MKKRREIWKQPNPQFQLVTVIGAARGINDNLAAGIYKPEAIQEQHNKLDELLEQAVELTHMVKGDWPE